MIEVPLEKYLCFNECEEWGKEFIHAIKVSAECFVSSIHLSSSSIEEDDSCKRLIFAMMCANSSIELFKSIEESLKLKLFDAVKEKNND